MGGTGAQGARAALDGVWRPLHWNPLGSLVVVIVVQALSGVQLFATPRTAVHQASLSFTNPWSLLKLMSVGLSMPSNHLILCQPLLLPPSIFASIRAFSNELAV